MELRLYLKNKTTNELQQVPIDWFTFTGNVADLVDQLIIIQNQHPDSDILYSFNQ